MEKLDNPVYYALVSGDASLSEGTDQVKYFNMEISPFVGFEEGYSEGFNDLHDLLPPGRKILYATRKQINEPPEWKLAHEIKGLQFLYSSRTIPLQSKILPQQLDEKNVEEMV